MRRWAVIIMVGAIVCSLILLSIPTIAEVSVINTPTISLNNEADIDVKESDLKSTLEIVGLIVSILVGIFTIIKIIIYVKNTMIELQK